MPLDKLPASASAAKKRACVSANVSRLMAEGKKRSQAVAIALQSCGVSQKEWQDEAQSTKSATCECLGDRIRGTFAAFSVRDGKNQP